MKLLLAVPGIFAAGSLALHVQAGITFTSLMSFDQTNGDDPQAGLAQGLDGNFYGTTTRGGINANGTIFQITPTGVFTNLISFAGTNGASPRSGLLLGMDGSFYGTTYTGGSNNAGIIFQITTNGVLSTLQTFSFAGGGFPIGGLVQDQGGNLYGTTAVGGTNSGGTVFRLATNGIIQTLDFFNISGNGGNSPYAGLLRGSNANYYGTTYQGGTNGYGTIYEINTNGALTTLVSFGNTNGANPYAGLISDLNGNLYGTTYQGGANGYGTVFELHTNGTLTTLVSFGNTNGATPQAGLFLGMDGNLYGTTSAGGDLSSQPAGHGTVFKLSTNGTLTSLILFNGTNGDSPQGSLIQDAQGNFYSTTAGGGTNGFGTVFRFSITVTPPRFLDVAAMNNIVTLTWSATAQETYQMLYKTNLNQASWSNLNGSVLATNTVMTTFDAVGPDTQRFYQILLLP